MSKFNTQTFSARAFAAVADRTPDLKITRLTRSRALVSNPDIQAVFGYNNSAGYAKVAVRGILDGDALNYDGVADIDTPPANRYEQGVTVIGRAKAWTESDFAYDVSGVDFMDGAAIQLAKWKDELTLKTLLATLKGVYGISAFAAAHTLDVRNGDDYAPVDAVSLNRAAVKACGDEKKKFTAVIMHSDVATNLENLNMLEHLKYTDKNGITADTELRTWNGRTVITDNNVPVSDGAYTTYLLGEGAFSYENIPVKNACEMFRDPKTAGGRDILFTRSRSVFAPYGISYLRTAQVSASPTDGELAAAVNWALTADLSGGGVIDHKLIPIARIISAG